MPVAGGGVTRGVVAEGWVALGVVGGAEGSAAGGVDWARAAVEASARTESAASPTTRDIPSLAMLRAYAGGPALFKKRRAR